MLDSRCYRLPHRPTNFPDRRSLKRPSVKSKPGVFHHEPAPAPDGKSVADGVFTFGGTGTLLYGAKIGLEKAVPNVRRTGLRASAVLVCSDRAHYACRTVANWLGLGDSKWALVVTYPTFLVPFCTWLLIGYFKSIPYELEECALVDGATRLQILRRITLPLAVPGLISWP